MWHVKALLNNSTTLCTCGDSSLSKKESKRASKEVKLVLGKGNGNEALHTTQGKCTTYTTGERGQK